ncbi:hypothetical protein C4D60_Mb10t01460 [Musa balbisiana]|uniref:Uncharacterized protein n=1 Tax=Musa balbisiana TaxID=52838 RepID=A0A4S8ITU5_MUSBA|nr:hypothetical protein C4D60_Mb10t01460 [Musa balbisiana]
MEVVVPVPDFHFDSACTSPYVSAPSSPKRSGDPFNFFRHYTSAPTSPTRASAIYAHFNAISSTNSLSPPAAASGVPFDWEEKPGTPKSRGSSPAKDEQEDVLDFAFDFSGHLDKQGLPVLTTADELFEEGKIRPLKPPPRLQYRVTDDGSSVASSPRSPKQRDLWSPRHRGRGGRGEQIDPFTAAMVEATRDRGRATTPTSPSFSSSRSRKGSRSLSPFRGGVSFFKTTPNSPPATASTASLKSGGGGGGGGGSKKWRLKDLLLFRSASEGRATGNRSKDPLRKYTLLPSSSSSIKKSVTEDPKNSSFRSTDSSGSIRRGSGHFASSHQMHYAANRAATEELKKKTALPYRQSLFGCLRFNPAVLSISRGFNTHSFGRR